MHIILSIFSPSNIHRGDRTANRKDSRSNGHRSSQTWILSAWQPHLWWYFWCHWHLLYIT